MSGSGDPVVVIGGGVIGALSAWYLTEAGHAVTIVDKARFAGACSHGNCGYISPSHVLPLTAPGAIANSLKSMLRGPSKSPFYIRPRLSLDLWRWLWRFARRCNERDMLAAAETLNALLQSSAQLYEVLIAREQLQCEWEKKGLIFVYQTKKEWEHYAEINRFTTERFGMSAEPWDSKTLAAREPALKPGLAGGWFFDVDSHLRPDKLMSELRRKLEARGVRIVEQCSVEGFVSENGRARAVRTNTGEIAGSQFVVAAGALTPFLNKALGCRIPIQPGKGYSLTMPRPAICPTYPMIFEEHRVAITPMQSAYRIGSTMEFAGYDTSINPRRLKLLTDGASLYLREPTAAPVLETWYGWRPMTWDSLPYIDRIPAIGNAWIAAGHNMLGLSLGAVTGKLIAELASGEKPHLDLKPLSVARAR
jgi:D-amino-acid dehydrogenase